MIRMEKRRKLGFTPDHIFRLGETHIYISREI